MPKALCTVCPRACALEPGESGFCRARVNTGAGVEPLFYGAISALNLDHIEKKPLLRFYPGSAILSMGGFGCNMRCDFCQNHTISQQAPESAARITPEALVDKAKKSVALGGIGLAFTYNEPGINLEFVLEASRQIKCAKLKSVMVTNGYLSHSTLQALLPLIDAWNIDLKCFTREGYERLGGDLEIVKRAIALVSKSAHLEVTTLIVPGLSDSEADMEREAEFLAALSPDIPLHLTRYFPAYKSKRPATEREVVRRLGQIAKGRLNDVSLGNW